MDISLVIPAHNEEKYIGACLESVLKNAPGKFRDIIVVDNASSDKTAAVAGGYPGVRVVREDRKGTGFARQTGLETVATTYVAYTDADCIVPAGWADEIVALFAKYPNASCVTGSVRYFGISRPKQILLSIAWWSSVPLMHALTGSVVIGGNFAVRRDMLLAAGGFDTRTEFYGDDTALAIRLRSRGPIIFRMPLFIETSARRFAEEGIAATLVNYAFHFFTTTIYRAPTNAAYSDVRVEAR